MFLFPRFEMASMGGLWLSFTPFPFSFPFFPVLRFSSCGPSWAFWALALPIEISETLLPFPVHLSCLQRWCEKRHLPCVRCIDDENREIL